MSNPDTNPTQASRSGLDSRVRLSPVHLIVLGIGFLILGAVLVLNTPNTDATTEGRVSHISGTVKCRIAAEFIIDGTTYTTGKSSRNSGNCNKAIGSVVTVHYQKADPAESTLNHCGDIPGYTLVSLGALTTLGAGTWAAIRRARRPRT